MPRIDGDEFITRFRASPGSGHVPIMMITVCGQRQKRLRALESGATDFLRAPVDHCEFITRARNLLRLSRSAARDPEPPAPTRDAAPEEESGDLLARCGAEGYAFHAIEITLSAEASEPAPDFSPLLAAQLREGDVVTRLDPLRYAVLQFKVARPADARALSRRLQRAHSAFEGVAAFRVGLALPRAGAEPAAERAAACLREAFASMRLSWRAESVGAVRERWRLAPIVDLTSGALDGVELQDIAGLADFSDPDALSAALACAAEIKRAAAENFRICLRLNLLDDGVEIAALRLPPLLARLEVEPARLDLMLSLGDILDEGARAEALAQSMRALGVGLTLDLGAPLAEDAEGWPILSRAFDQGGRPALRFSCADEEAVERARSFRAGLERLLGAAPVLRAADVPSPALLPALRRAGIGWAQGPCFGAPFEFRDIKTLLAARSGASEENRARRA